MDNKEKELEKQKAQSEENNENENEDGGFPENIDFKKFLGCGG